MIYVEFQSLGTETDDSTQPYLEKSFTENSQHNQPSGFFYIVPSTYEKYSKPPVAYRGEGAVDNSCSD